MITALTALILAAPALPQEAAKTPPQERPSVWDILSADYDRNKDGKISPDEHGRGKERFARLDTDGDGFITKADIDSQKPSMRPPKGLADPRKQKAVAAQGKPAPDFSLPLLGAKPAREVKLSSFQGKKPVALIFGSYT